MEEPIIDEYGTMSIRMCDLVVNEAANCRQKIDPLDVVTLWQTIERDGLIQPITVRRVPEGYQIICGFRRWKAHLVGKAERIKVRIIQCNDEDAKVLNLVENLERKQLNPLEEALSIQKLMFQGWTQQRIADRFRMTRQWVIQRQNLLKLPEVIQQDVASGQINMSHVAELVKLKDTVKQIETVKAIKDASIRGEKISGAAMRQTYPTNVAPKKARIRTEIQEMLLFVMEQRGPSFGTRALSWASGEISTDEFLEKDVNRG